MPDKTAGGRDEPAEDDQPPSTRAAGSAGTELGGYASLSRYLRATADAATRITSRLDFDYVLRTVAGILVEEMGAALAQVWLTPPREGAATGTDALYLRMQAGPAGEEMPEEIHWTALPLWLDSVVRGAQPVVFRDPAGDGRLDARWVAAHGIVAVVALPLSIAHRARGVMICALREQVSVEMLAILESFAAIVATSLNDVQHFVREQEARADAERAERDFAFLAEASRALASSLEYDTTLKTAVHLTVPYLADWCVMDIVRSDQGIRRVHVAHHTADRDEVAMRIAHYHPTVEDNPEVAAVLRMGQALLVPDATEERIRSAAPDPEYRRAVLALGVTSYMRVPMVVRGEVYGVLSLVSSDPARHYAQADLALAEDFARRVAAAVDNAGLYAELRTAVRLRDEFLSTVSHDLKNPIAAIKGRAQMLLRRVNHLPEDERARFAEGLEAINTTSDRMARLISDLVDVARLRSGTPIELRRAPVDLVQIARRVAGEHQSATPDHTIVVQAPSGPLVGRWDGDRLERVVDNLVSNAVKYSVDGGEVRIEVAYDQERARLTVSDRGVGIPASELPRVFDRFFRASNVERMIPGSGIGLAGARQIVRQHGGTITVQSRVGEGSAFTVWLPLRDMPGEEALHR